MRTVRGWAFPDDDEQMAAELGADGGYQSGHLAEALRHVTDWTAAVDGGAHVGTWSRMMATAFARVLAFEPSRDTFEALQANMAAFGCANVETVNAALGATPGAVEMAIDAQHAARRNTGARYVGGAGSIPRVTVDSLALETLGFLKLDVEGSEPLALMGARATLERCRPVVLYENKGLWSRYGLKPDACAQLLRKAGYRRLATAGRDDIWGPA